jgi:hypothetical protein
MYNQKKIHYLKEFEEPVLAQKAAPKKKLPQNRSKELKVKRTLTSVGEDEIVVCVSSNLVVISFF